MKSQSNKVDKGRAAVGILILGTLVGLSVYLGGMLEADKTKADLINNFSEQMVMVKSDGSMVKPAVKTTDLYTLAKLKLEDLQASDYFSHNRSTDNADFSTRVSEINTEGYGYYGEILYVGKCDIQEATRLWNDSPKHAVIMHDLTNNEMIMLMGRTKKDPNACYIVGEYRK